MITKQAAVKTKSRTTSGFSTATPFEEVPFFKVLNI